MKSHLCHVFISTCNVFCPFYIHFYCCTAYTCGSVADWLACWTQAQKGLGSNRSRDAVGNSLRQTAHIICASLHQAAKLVAALLRVVWVTAGLVQSNSSLPLGLWLASPAGWLPRTGISSRTLRSVIKYGLPFLHVHLLRVTLDINQSDVSDAHKTQDLLIFFSIPWSEFLEFLEFTSL